MEALVIEPRTKSDARFLRNFSKRIGAKIIDPEEWIEDMVLGRLIEEGLKEPEYVSSEEVMKFLNE